MNCVTATAPEVVTPMKLEMTPQVEERPGCLRSMLNGIAKFWSVVWEKGCLLFQATTMLFFRAISWLSPWLGNKLEIAWGHITTIYERVAAAYREDELKEEIKALQTENRTLTTRVDGLMQVNEKLIVQVDHLTWERNQVIEQRDTARVERDEKISGKAQLLRTCDTLESRFQEKERMFIDLQEQLQKEMVAKEGMIGERTKLQVELDLARQEVDIQRNQAIANQALSDQFDRIREAYANSQPGEGASATEAELLRLIPLWDNQKQAYIEMIDQCLEMIPTDSSLQIPLQGLKEVASEQSDHLKRISEAIHLSSQQVKGVISVLRDISAREEHVETEIPYDPRAITVSTLR